MEGKLAPSEDFYKADKFHALHKRMDDIRKRADRKFSSTASASSLKRKSSSTKVQWQYLVHRLHIVPDPDVSNVPIAEGSTAGPSEPEPEAEPLQANGDLNHEVQGDRSEDLRRKKKSKESVVHSNPIYEAFENVEDVDDLYRLADTLIYSAYTDSMSWGFSVNKTVKIVSKYFWDALEKNDILNHGEINIFFDNFNVIYLWKLFKKDKDKKSKISDEISAQLPKVTTFACQLW
jgi:hypothetical protein